MRSKKTLALLLSAALIPTIPWAQGGVVIQEAAEERADDPMEIVEALLDEYDAAMKAFYDKYEAAQTDEARDAAFESAYPDPADYVPRLMAVVEQYPQTEAALEALSWVLANDRGGIEMGAILDLLRAHHLESEGVGEICELLPGHPSLDTERFLRDVIEENPHRAAQGKASYALARMLSAMLGLRDRLDGADAEQLERYARRYDEGYLEHVRGLDPVALRAEHLALLEKVAAEYQDVRYWSGTLAEAAAGELFEMQHLQIGMVAPEIEDVDLDGVSFKLSDYRGKVVFLDFWGDW